MQKDFYSYPAFFYHDSDGISIEFPDLPGCLTCASDTEAAFRRAKEVMGLYLYGLEEDGESIPAPTPAADLRPESGAVVTVAMVEAYMPVVRAKVKKTTTKKTLTIPSWLNAQAEQAGINFSAVLQAALKQQLGIQ